MTAQNIISWIGAFGLGSVATAIIASWLKQREKKSEANQIFKDVRYKAILLLMYAFVEWERESKQLAKRPDIQSKEDLLNELKAEWANMTLYASDKVISTMKGFIFSPTYETLAKCTLAMRFDLYGLKTWLKPKDLTLNDIYGED